MIPTTLYGFIGLLLAAITVCVGYTAGVWLIGKILR